MQQSQDTRKTDKVMQPALSSPSLERTQSNEQQSI